MLFIFWRGFISEKKMRLGRDDEDDDDDAMRDVMVGLLLFYSV